MDATPCLQQNQQAAAEEASCMSRITSEVLFYRTQYKLSKQQLTLPRGVYALYDGEHRAIQLYVAEHAATWDADEYLRDRTSVLQQIASSCSKGHHPTADGTTTRDNFTASADQCCSETSDAADCSADCMTSEAGRCSRASCYPGCQLANAPDSSCSTSSTEADGDNSSISGASTGTCDQQAPNNSGLAAVVAAAVSLSPSNCQTQLCHNPEPDQMCQDPSQAASRQLLWSAEAANSWSQGFGPGSTLRGPFQALAKAQSGPREGMCRISRVQHRGQLKGIWHASRHVVVLYERVGLTLIIHVKPRNLQDGSRKRLPAQMYNLPGAGLGRQIYPGSVTQMLVDIHLSVAKTGAIPLKLPQALVLSQFSTQKMPLTVSLDVLLDGQPADLSMQVQNSSGSSSSVRVQREAIISNLPRSRSYCLCGLTSAGLGTFEGCKVVKISAPGGNRVVLHLQSAPAQAAQASHVTTVASNQAEQRAPAAPGGKTLAETTAASVQQLCGFAACTAAEEAEGGNSTQQDSPESAIQTADSDADAAIAGAGIDAGVAAGGGVDAAAGGAGGGSGGGGGDAVATASKSSGDVITTCSSAHGLLAAGVEPGAAVRSPQCSMPSDLQACSTPAGELADESTAAQAASDTQQAVCNAPAAQGRQATVRTFWLQRLTRTHVEAPGQRITTADAVPAAATAYAVDSPASAAAGHSLGEGSVGGSSSMTKHAVDSSHSHQASSTLTGPGKAGVASSQPPAVPQGGGKGRLDMFRAILQRTKQQQQQEGPTTSKAAIQALHSASSSDAGVSSDTPQCSAGSHSSLTQHASSIVSAWDNSTGSSRPADASAGGNVSATSRAAAPLLPLASTQAQCSWETEVMSSSEHHPSISQQQYRYPVSHSIKRSLPRSRFGQLWGDDAPAGHPLHAVHAVVHVDTKRQRV